MLRFIGVVLLVGVLSALSAGSMTAAEASPGNDDFASAQALPRAGGTLGFSNAGATKEMGEPDHAGNEGGASVWFSWTPDFTGTASVDTNGSGFDTLLAVYTGSSIGALALVGSNDDFDSSASASRVCFPVVAGQTWKIVVDGFDGAAGSVALNWGPKSDAGPCPMLPPQLGGAIAEPQVGDTLTTTEGSFIDGGSSTVRWLRCAGDACHAIAGATGNAYVLSDSDAGTSVLAEVTSTGGGTSARNASAPTGVVAIAPIVQPNGRIFWYWTHIGRSSYEDNLSSMFLDGSARSDGYAMAAPAVSPDGTLVIGSTAPGGELRLETADGRSGIQTDLYGESPTWSPDGSRVAFIHYADTGAASIEVWDVPGGFVSGGLKAVSTIRTFQAGMNPSGISWAPDGTEFALSYTPFGPSPQLSYIAVLPADGKGPLTVLSSSSEPQFAPRWSPSGDAIVFKRGVVPSNGPGDADLWIMDWDGANQRKLYDGDPMHAVETAAWSPDGTRILFSRYDRGVDIGHNHSDLFTIPPGGGTPTQLTQAADGEYNTNATWAPLAAYALTVETAGTGSGSVTSSPSGISCGATCEAIFDDPATVTLQVAPAAGSSFSGWSGDCFGTGPCVVSMYGDRDVTATFTVAGSSGSSARPGPPTSVLAVAGNGTATVSWAPPTSAGSSPITGYTVISPVAGVSVNADASARSVVITGLQNGRGYTFAVFARNAAGAGALANANSVVPAAPADPPEGVTAVRGNASARVSWTPAANTGGSRVTAYIVTASPGGIVIEAAAPNTTAVVSGLSNGTAYTFTVVARSAAGLSAPSAPSNAVTPATVPDVPTNVTARAGNASATVSWQPPTSDGGAAISGYVVVATPDGADATAGANARTAVVEHLRNGVSYTFEVYAENAVGAGQVSLHSNAVTPRAPVARPRISGITPMSGPHGATVKIRGTGFGQTTAVTFHSKRATFRIVSKTLLKATVPRRATTGRITVRTRGGLATSVRVFKVTKSVSHTHN